jgi:activator of HSP90 ATPase
MRRAIQLNIREHQVTCWLTNVTRGIIIMSNTIHQEIMFNTSAQQIYDALTNSKRFSELTEAPAEISAVSGGQFACFGGMITGQIVEAIPGLRLVQVWRVGSWEPGIYSIVKFDLERIEDMKTKLIFDHTAFSEEHRDHLEEGWHARYWTPLKNYFNA